MFPDSNCIYSDDMMYLCSCVKQGIGILGMPYSLTANFAMEGVAFVPEESPGLLWVVTCYYIENRITPKMHLLISELTARVS